MVIQTPVSYQMDNAPSTMTFVLIIYSLLEKLVPWKGLNWDIGDEL